jgi:hypothetical protein
MTRLGFRKTTIFVLYARRIRTGRADQSKFTRVAAAGASRRDLRLVLCDIACEAAFGTLYALSNPGLEDDDVSTLYEELLMADPSGMEGHRGFWGCHLRAEFVR